MMEHLRRKLNDVHRSWTYTKWKLRPWGAKKRKILRLQITLPFMRELADWEVDVHGMMPFTCPELMRKFQTSRLKWKMYEVTKLMKIARKMFKVHDVHTYYYNTLSQETNLNYTKVKNVRSYEVEESRPDSDVHKFRLIMYYMFTQKFLESHVSRKAESKLIKLHGSSFKECTKLWSWKNCSSSMYTHTNAVSHFKL